MTNEQFVKSIHPDAKLARYFMFNKWNICVHSYDCGEMLDEYIGWKVPPPPKNCEEAWKQAADYCNREVMRKLEK